MGPRQNAAARPAASRSTSAVIVAAVALALALLAPVVRPSSASELGPPEDAATRQVMFVGNNWEGSATIIDARTFETLATLNTIPDRDERMAEIMTSPDELGYFLAIRQAVGEGNDQFTDDMFTSHDGRTVFVSRPSFADVVAIDLRTGEIAWRFPMEGYRSDHMAISPDGTRLLVSDSTANVVHEIDTATGEGTGQFPSGDSPHENVYIHDGDTVLHASIGRVYTPTDQEELGLVRDTSKGERVFQVVDAETLEIRESWDIGERLAAAGHDDMSAAVRPMAPHPDGQRVFFQVSFHHGFVEFDLESGEVLRVADLPVSEEAEATPREEYLLDSAHHGLALNPSGETLCVAGTMSDYAAMVDAETFEHEIVSEGTKPYWSTNGPDGQHCWVSYSGDDTVAVIDYATGAEVARVDVGDHPQRVRPGVVRHDILGDPASVTFAGTEGVTRLSGDDRFATAARVAAATFPEGAPIVFVATGAEPADALSVGPLAGRAAGPVLLTAPDALPDATRTALEAMAPQRVVVVGGEAAVSPSVEGQIADATDAVVERVAGPDRFATSAALAERFAPGPAPVVYLAGGGAAADALAGGPVAGAEQGVLLLTGRDAVPGPVVDQLRRLAPQRIVVLGGEQAVSTSVETDLADFEAEVTRIAGTDRFETAAMVAERLPDATIAYVANGRSVVDALVGAVAAMADGAPVVLTEHDVLPDATRAHLAAMRPTQVVVLGGEAAVSAAVEAELAELTGGGAGAEAAE